VKRSFLATSGLIALVVLPCVADGNGGTLRVSRAAAGPYLISAWTQPDPPRVGRLDLSVAVMAPDSGQAILGAAVRANATPTARQQIATSARLAIGEGGNPLLYHGNVDLPVAGAWRIVIEAGGPDGVGTTAFELEVRPPVPIAWPIALAVVALGAGGALWWARARRRRARPR
jgi:hypothetical protein